MKKLIASAAAVAILAGFSTFVFTASGQNSGAQQTPRPTKIALIDMAYVFKNYKKFEVLREDLKTEIGQSDQKARQMAQQIQTLQEQMKSLKEGSPDYIELEKRVAQQTSDFDAFRKVAQKDFLRKESQLYKTIYLEVVDLVKGFAEANGYTMVLRFDRDDVGDAENPNEVLKNMNRLVVYHRSTDDLTTHVLDYLNRRYASSSGSSKSRTGENPNKNSRKN